MSLAIAPRSGLQLLYTSRVTRLVPHFQLYHRICYKKSTRLRIDPKFKLRNLTMSGDQQGDSVQKYTSVIRDFLSGNAEAGEAAVRSIIEPIATQLSKPSEQSAADDQLHALWTSILNTVQTIKSPYDLSGTPDISSDTLQTLHRIQSLLDVIRTAPDQFQDIPQPGAAQIAKLPGFGVTARDRFNVSDTDTPGAWTDLNAFLAVLWCACDPESDYTQPEAYDYGLYSIWSLRDALETEQSPEQLNLLLPAAATWILIAGGVIARTNRQFPPSRKTGAPARAGPLLVEALKKQGEEDVRIEGFDEIRWQFWRDRFQQIAQEGDISQDVKSIASAASSQMVAQ